MHVIKLDGYNATVENGEKLELGTFDSYGEEQLQIVKAPDWENLSVIATFNPPYKKPVQAVANSVTGVIKVPKEATADSYGVGTIVFVGFADGVRRISSDVEYIVRRHSNASDTEPAEPTPDLLQQVLTLSRDAQTAAKNAEQSAKNAAKDAADTVKPYKEEAVQAATAAAGSANAAGNSASAAARSEQAAGASEVKAAKSEKAAKASEQAAAKSAQAALKSKTAAATSEVNAATSAKKAQAVADSLPEDYTTAVNDIATLKQQVANITPDDSAIGDKPWSSKHIIDMLCPPLEESGNPVACYPVAGYPLGVKANWEPTQEGTGTPSPENIRPIKGRDSVTVERCGENILNPKAYTSKITNGITFTVNEDKSVRIVGTATGRATFPLYLRKNKMSLPDGKYAFSTIATLPTGTRLLIGCYYKSSDVYKKNLISLRPGENSQTVSLQGVEWLDGFIDVASGNTIDTTLYPILILGTTVPTTYIPYIGQTNTLTLPETVYGGEIDAVTGAGRRTWKTLTLDGSEDWYTLTDSNAFYWNGFQVWGTEGQPEKAYCSIAAYDSGRDFIDEGKFSLVGFEHETGWIGFRFTAYTLETWKAYLAAQNAAGTPVQITYKAHSASPRLRE